MIGANGCAAGTLAGLGSVREARTRGRALDENLRQPRALAAVAQPIGRLLRVTGHWRLLSLNSWLTVQLRYLVFHGPARLVVQGGRGCVWSAPSGRAS